MNEFHDWNWIESIFWLSFSLLRQRSKTHFNSIWAFVIFFHSSSSRLWREFLINTISMKRSHSHRLRPVGLVMARHISSVVKYSRKFESKYHDGNTFAEILKNSTKNGVFYRKYRVCVGANWLPFVGSHHRWSFEQFASLFRKTFWLIWIHLSIKQIIWVENVPWWL